MQLEVSLKFREKVNQLFKTRPEIAQFVNNHERRNLVVENLCREIVNLESSHVRQSFDLSTYDVLIGDIAKMFAEACLNKAEEDVISRLERQRRIDESERIEKTREEFEAISKEEGSEKIVSYLSS